MAEESSGDASQSKGGCCNMVVLFLLSAILPALFLFGFTGMGVGLEMIAQSYELHDEAAKVVTSTLILLCVMWIFDSHFWPIPLRALVWFGVFCAFAVSVCFLVSVTPWGPLCIFTILMPLSLVGIKRIFYKRVEPHLFCAWIYYVLVFMASILLVGFFYWNYTTPAGGLNGNNMWDSPTAAVFSHAAGCEPCFDELPECENPDLPGVPCFWDANHTVVSFPGECTARCLAVYEECEEAFIIWANPGLAAMALFVTGFVAGYLSEPDDPHAHHGIGAVAKFSVVFLFLFWIFASLVGAGEGLSSSLIAFAIAMVIGASIIFSAVFWTTLVSKKASGGGDSDEEEGEEGGGKSSSLHGAAKQAEGYMDIFRGLVVLGFTPLVLAYLLISVLNQFVRRFFTRHCCKKRMSQEEYDHRGCVTLSAYNQIQDFKGWDHSKVLSIAVYWGVGYVFLNVLASKFTTVFLSWLIETTSTMSIPKVTGIVIAVGMVLFMLPPIPGLPIYLTAGIVLVSIGKDAMGLWGAIGYACAVSLVLKLLACAVQQKLIGAQLGGSVSVKQMVSINSDGIRAMRVMLSDRGITSRKVAVLVGGPDWPVSVLCGILGLDLFPILVGTLPVIALIAPTVLTGSFAYMESLEDEDGADLYPWAGTMGAIASAVAAGCMLFFNIMMAGAVKETLVKDKDTIAAIPLDEAVAVADELAEKKTAAYRRVTVWSIVPFFMKSVLVMAVLLMMGCVYLLVVFNSRCFREYDLMYTIGEHLEGNWTNIVEPLGRLSLLLFAVSYGLLKVFECWASGKTDAALKDMEDSEAVALTETKVATYA